ncbi:hypothetical protein G7047_15615 [Diaphorobacter sp. HDW4A]|uniref:hypothetical protein n=1 Tax=Diaphorobacter sp. HDW4A TaxID=2714924 RepID=UPI00140B905B|nr:hypothetical protein [Diaphorobacter sp. HDW4A]QIL81173.1 hypothetical protein G7047_15615 [Diaphorobacter sp. HDW4A]
MVQAHIHTELPNHRTIKSLLALRCRLFLCQSRTERHQHAQRKLHRLRRADASRIPGHYGPREHLSLAVRALHVRIHTFTLKFLQGHT